MTLCQTQPSADPNWWQGAAIYQIYPRSFADANNDGIGDIAGITAHLDHIASLNVDAIWLSPFFTSPMADFGYDVADYRDVDPMFGTLGDFKTLLDSAHARGLRVLIDQVLSHSSDAHAWFAESRADRTNAKADWYVWADPAPDGGPPNNWMAAFGGVAWTFDARRTQYYLHNFLPEQPDLNFHNPDVQQAQLDNLAFWLDLGVDGFRFDVVNFYFHNATLADNPPREREHVNPGHPQSYQWQRHNTNQPENLAYLERIRALMDQYPGAMAVGEIGGDDELATMADYTRGRQRLHMAYTFDLLGDTGNAAHIRATLADFAALGEDTWPCWALSNHDVVRSASKWGADRALLGLGVLASLRGNICIYQGEELGLPEAELRYEELQDPFGINLWPLVKGRDGCRTPMPWDNAPQAGFCGDDVTPWLPIGQGHRERAVVEQDKTADSFLSQVRELLAQRRAHAALTTGRQEIIADAHPDLLVLRRETADQSLLCVAHLGTSDTVTRRLQALAPEAVSAEPIALSGLGQAELVDDTLTLAPGSLAWFTLHD